MGNWPSQRPAWAQCDSARASRASQGEGMGRIRTCPPGVQVLRESTLGAFSIGESGR